MQQKPLVSIVLDTRKANKEKLYPIKLRVTFKVGDKWVQNYYSLGRAVSEADFKTIWKGNPRSANHQAIRNELVQAESNARNIYKSQTFVTPESFDRVFRGTGNITTVGSVFNMVMAELKESGQIGTYLITKTTRNSVARFVDRKLVKMKTRKKEDTVTINISFVQITIDWLKKYQRWLFDQGVSSTTIGMYMEVIRKIYNRGISMRLVNPDVYPFGKNGYTIKKPRARKIALTEEEKNQLLSLTEFQYSIDFWAFSFFCYGLNTTDIAMLRFKDLHQEVIHIPRQKTINTSGNVLQIPLRQEAKDIIQRRGNKSLDPEEYIFPILTKGLTPTQRKNRITDFVDKVNKDLKKAGEKLGLTFKLTTYTARHTFASIALEKGASLEFIQIALGHGSMATTEIYTSGFGIKTKRAIGERIYDG